MSCEYIAVFAYDENTYAFGRENSLPWHNVKSDISFLKEQIQWAAAVILSRALLKSLPKSFKDFLEGENVEIHTMHRDGAPPEVIVDLLNIKFSGKKVLVLGGREIFNIFLRKRFLHKCLVTTLNFSDPLVFDSETKSARGLMDQVNNMSVSKSEINTFTDENTSNGICTGKITEYVLRG